MTLRIALHGLLIVAGLSSCAGHDGSIRLASTEDQPPLAVIERIEAHLQKDECVGQLSKWARFYRWGTSPSDYDGSLPRSAKPRNEEVEVILREAGKFGYKAGIYIEPSPPVLASNELFIESDHRDYLVAFGDYKVATDALDLWSCGPNLDADPGELVGQVRL